MSRFARVALGGALLAGVVGLSADLANDVVTYSILKEQAVELAGKDESLCELIGEPFVTGPWYSSSIGFTHKGHIATSTFQLTGTKRATDVQVRAVRRTGYPLTLLYNLVGPAEWQLMTCQAMMPGSGGLAQPKNLLPVPPKAQAAGGPSDGTCPT
jgi:hypothetical protein